MSQISSQAAELRRQQLEYSTSITKLYSRHASTLFAHFDEWKGNDAFYFVELRLDMAYVASSGLIAEIAHPPYYLGTMVRNTLLHPELFACECPHGHRAYAYTYSGSPLSGSVSQAMACPVCGWNQYMTGFSLYKLPAFCYLCLMSEYYRHFKGNVYRLIGIAKDSETLEERVVYQAMYGDGDLWVRPYDMFFGKVERDGKVFDRFSPISEEEALKDNMPE